jgi:hypothetical protein
MRRVLFLAVILMSPSAAVAQIEEFARLVSVTATPSRIDLRWDRDIMAIPVPAHGIIVDGGAFWVGGVIWPYTGALPTENVLFENSAFTIYGKYTTSPECGYVDGWTTPQCRDEEAGIYPQYGYDAHSILGWNAETYTLSLPGAPEGARWRYTGVSPRLEGFVQVPEPSSVALLLAAVPAVFAFRLARRVKRAPSSMVGCAEL